MPENISCFTGVQYWTFDFLRLAIGDTKWSFDFFCIAVYHAKWNSSILFSLNPII